MSKSGMYYVIFYIFGVKNLNFTLRNVIDAMCKEIIIHHQTVTIATDKHDYILRIHTDPLAVLGGWGPPGREGKGGNGNGK